ncbi:MAG: HNH endonuclease, partial [Cyanobacteria bacterium J06607_13]
RGDITPEEFKSKIIEAAVSAGLATPIFFVIFIAVMAVFPEVVVVLSAPAVVAGFNVLFGIGVALPIVESLVRHIEADGFGSEWKAQYEGTISQGEAIVQDLL